jgi:hypothetical protein
VRKKTLVFVGFLLASSGTSPKAARADGYINLRGTELQVTFESALTVDPGYAGMFETANDLVHFASTSLAREKTPPNPEWGWLLPEDNRPENLSLFLQIHAKNAIEKDQVFWDVGGSWKSTTEMELWRQSNTLSFDEPVRFQIREINAVVVTPKEVAADASIPAEPNITEGFVFETRVPKRPASLFQEVEEPGSTYPSCATFHQQLSLSSSIYWYVWNPDKESCPEDKIQPATATVDRVRPFNVLAYPEYDRLLADTTVTVAMIYGKLDETSAESDSNWETAERVSRWLCDEHDFTEIPVTSSSGRTRRFERGRRDLDEDLAVVIDVYYPDYIAGLSYASPKWNSVIREHEVVIYHGHSMLGSGRAFYDASYPDFYQIYLIASCLSYGYYVPDVLRETETQGTDVISDVVEGKPVEWNNPMIRALVSKLVEGVFDPHHRVSWQEIMKGINQATSMSYVGVSGAADNVFRPQTVESITFDNNDEVIIADATTDSSGWFDEPVVTEAGPIFIEDEDEVLTIRSLSVATRLSHPYLDHLSLTLRYRDLDGNESVFVLADRDGELVPLGLPSQAPAPGEWTLFVVDEYNDELWSLEPATGVLHGWSMTIEPFDSKTDTGGLPGESAGGCSASGSAATSSGWTWGLLLLGGLFCCRRRRRRGVCKLGLRDRAAVRG